MNKYILASILGCLGWMAVDSAWANSEFQRCVGSGTEQLCLSERGVFGGLEVRVASLRWADDGMVVVGLAHGPSSTLVEKASLSQLRAAFSRLLADYPGCVGHVCEGDVGVYTRGLTTVTRIRIYENEWLGLSLSYRDPRGWSGDYVQVVNRTEFLSSFRESR